MKIDAKYTGTKLKDFITHINWRHTMNYAAAINDTNDKYFNDEREQGVIAHPANCVAITWPVSERIWEYADIEDFPMEIVATQVHYSEHLEIHKPVKPGDKLTIKGKIAAILPHRAGTHLVIKYEATDENGMLVFTEHTGAMMRGVSCTGNSNAQELLPSVPENISPSELWKTEIFVDPLRPFIYDGCSGIFFPIHTSVKFARQVGLPGIILQGTATLAMTISSIIENEANGNPERIKTICCRFTGMVRPDSNISIQLTGKNTNKDNTDLFFNTLNSSGQKAISNGYIKILN